MSAVIDANIAIALAIALPFMIELCNNLSTGFDSFESEPILLISISAKII